MSCFAFFSEYLGRCLNVRHARALPLCCLGAFAYLVSCAVCALRPAPYHLSPTVSLFLRLAWGAVVFVVSAMVLMAFVREATRSVKVLTGRLMHDKLTDGNRRGGSNRLPPRPSCVHCLSGARS